MKIHAVVGQQLQSGVMVILCAIPYIKLHGRFTVPYRNPNTKQGYQRKPGQTRIRKLAAEIRKGSVDIPTAVLLNLRGKEWKSAVAIDGHTATINLDALSQDFFVVDGQHRLTAMKSVVEDDEDFNTENLIVHCVIILGGDEKEEMKQFYTVNSTAKSVKTDLALELLKHQAENDGKFLDKLRESNQDWKVVAQSIIEELNENSPIWQGRIQMANQSKGRTLIPAASFAASLRTPLKSPFFQSMALDHKVRVINSYWKGIRIAVREPFDDNPNNYTLQKGIGVSVLHEILPNVIEVVKSRGNSVMDEQAYAEVMSPVFSELEGDNSEGPVSGPDFWLTAPLGGAAGTFSSSAGKRVLVAKLKTNLPDVEIF